MRCARHSLTANQAQPPGKESNDADANRQPESLKAQISRDRAGISHEIVHLAATRRIQRRVGRVETQQGQCERNGKPDENQSGQFEQAPPCEVADTRRKKGCPSSCGHQSRSSAAASLVSPASAVSASWTRAIRM